MNFMMTFHYYVCKRRFRCSGLRLLWEVEHLKIEEARQMYNVQIRTCNTKQNELSRKRQELEEKIKKTEKGATLYKNEAAVLELQYEALDKKRQEYQDYIEQLMEQWCVEANKESAKQQGEAMEEQAREMRKIMIVARRLMHGDKVPAKDEQKLMEFDPKLYAMAKNAGALAKLQKRKEHKSLWDEEELKENVNVTEKVNNMEAFADGPQVVDVEDTLAQATEMMPEMDVSFE